MFDFTNINLAVNSIACSIESEDRKKRKKVLEELTKEFSKYNAENPEFVTLFDAVRTVLWGCVNDKAEAVRDCAIDLLKDLLQRLPCNNKYLEEIVPVILYRLEDTEQREPSEEMRLKLVELLNLILEKYQQHIELFVPDIVQVVSQTLTDKYSKIRQECGKTCKILSSVRVMFLYEVGCKLVKPLIASFKHNHSKTRIGAIEALSDVLRYANWKNVDAQLVFGSLGERLFDDHPAVRLAVVELLGSWLMELRDRYSFFGRMVPLVLSCLSDQQPEVSARAWAVWSAAGREYLMENEQDLKEKMDFLDEKPLHYPLGVERPNLGCRTLVQRHICHMTSPLTQELTDWQPAVCVKASALLALLVLHAEADLTQHAENLLLAMYKVSENKEGIVPPESRSNIEMAAEYMGYFVAPAAWHKLVFPAVEAEPSIGNLFVLSALLRGSSPRSMEPYAERQTQILADPEICHTMKAPMQLEVLKCCRALLDNVDELSDAAVRSSIRCLLYVISAASYNPESALLAEAGQECLSLLAGKAGTTVADITKDNLTLLTNGVGQTVDAWSTAHPHFRLLLYLLAQPDAVWFSSVDEILDTLKKALQLDKGDPEVKSRLFASLAGIFENPEFYPTIGEEAFKKFAQDVVKELVVPNLTWRAGLSAEKLRTVVLTCLYCIMKSQRYQPDEPDQVLLAPTDLAPALIGSVRDTPTANRKLALECLDNVIKMTDKQEGLSTTLVSDIYPQVVDRLDDVNSEVRMAAITTLRTLLARLPKQMTENSHSAIFGHLVTALLPYLDDEDESFRNDVCEAVKLLSRRSPRVTKEKLAARMHLFRSQHLCTQIMDQCNASLSEE